MRDIQCATIHGQPVVTGLNADGQRVICTGKELLKTSYAVCHVEGEHCGTVSYIDKLGRDVEYVREVPEEELTRMPIWERNRVLTHLRSHT